MAASNQVLLRVFLVDETHKTAFVDPETTTVEGLWTIISDKLGLTPEDSECFFIWGISKDMEVLMYNDAKLSEVLQEWPSIQAEYTKPLDAFQPLKTLKRSASSLLHGNSDKSITKLTVNDKTRSFETLPNKAGHPTEVTRSSSLRNIPQYGSEISDDVPVFKLVYRTTSVLPLERELAAKSPAAIKLFYLQAVHNIISSNYPSDATLATMLAGVQLHVSAGNYNAGVHKPGYLALELHKYIPEHLRKLKSDEQWEAAILTEFARHKDNDSQTLMLLYLEAARKWRYYGSTFFAAKYVPTRQSFWHQPYEGHVIVGINHVGMHLVEPKEMKVASCSWDRIIWWNADKRTLTVQFQSSSNKGAQLLCFKTPQSPLISELMQDWMEEWEHTHKRAAK